MSPGGRRRALGAGVAWPLLVAWATLAAAAPPTPQAAGAGTKPAVQLHVDPCLDARRVEIRRLFGLELRLPLIDEADGDVASATRAFVACTADGGLLLRVDDPLTGKQLTRTFALASAPDDAQPRLVALALAELIYAAWSELALEPGPLAVTPRSEDRQAVEAAARVVRQKLAEPDPRLDVRLAAIGSLRRYQGGSTPLLGGGLRIGAEHGTWLGWNVDVLLERATAAANGGEVTCTAFSGSAWLTARLPWSFVDLHAGLGLRGGVGWLSGRPADETATEGGSVASAFFGPAGEAGLTVKLPARLLLDVRVEGGWVARPVSGTVDGAAAEAIRGAWVAGLLGVGWRP